MRSVKSFLVTFKLWPEDGKELVWHKARGGCSPAEGLAQAAGPEYV